MELETAFYIIAIIYMAVMLVIICSILAAVLVIKSRVNKAHEAVETQANKVKDTASRVAVGLNTVKYFLSMRD